MKPDKEVTELIAIINRCNKEKREAAKRLYKLTNNKEPLEWLKEKNK